LFANVNMCSFLHAALWFNQQGRNEGARGRNYPGAESLWGRRVMAGHQKITTMSHVILQYSIFASRRPHVRKWERQTCILPRAPSNLVTPLSSWRLVSLRNPSTRFYIAKLRCRQTGDSRTALTIALKQVFVFILKACNILSQ